MQKKEAEPLHLLSLDAQGEAEEEEASGISKQRWPKGRTHRALKETKREKQRKRSALQAEREEIELESGAKRMKEGMHECMIRESEGGMRKSSSAEKEDTEGAMPIEGRRGELTRPFDC